MKVLDTQTQYYISYWDSFDCEWLSFEYIKEYRPEWMFSDLTKATDFCSKLNEGLAFGNVHCGEYYEVKEIPDNA